MTDYKIYGASIERPMKYGRETGEEYIAVRLQVGKRPNLEAIRLTERQALALAAQLIDATRRSLP